MSDFLQFRRDRVITQLRGESNLIVALSGGVDSGVLLALALEALGSERVLAVTGVSAAVPASDIEDACAVARHLGASHERVETGELGLAPYRSNRGDRCYHCRNELFETLERLARSRGYSRIAYGAIKDDVGDDRPGMQAARERRVLAPLLDAGLSKDDVRALAAQVGLPVRDKPAAACLASRIPRGTEVTAARLGQIERCEAGLRRVGFGQVRVRHHGTVARLELDEAGFELLANPALRESVTRIVRDAGFSYVTLDLDGYRCGSLNPVAPGERQRTRPARDSGQ